MERIMLARPLVSEYVINIIDNSNFLRALLLLIKKDNHISAHETEVFIHEGTTLGFEKEFCESAIRTLLINENLNQSPPVFFNKANALKFLHIGVEFLNKDEIIDYRKVYFLNNVAIVNKVSDYWNNLLAGNSNLN